MGRPGKRIGLGVTPEIVRCAIYTRISKEEGPGENFTSISHQREVCESYIASRQNDGWILLPDRYEDSGKSGGTLDRPALKRLLQEAETSKVNLIVLYKLDRLSRSLIDFARLMEDLNQNNVGIAVATQPIDLSNSVGRMTGNLVMIFAQFEREMISERTKNKMGAARRKGKWVGGFPPIGYDVAAGGGKLLVNAEEADQIREIFRLYLENESLLPVVEAVIRRGWKTKTWKTKEGKIHQGGPFTKANIHRLVSNFHYIGKVRYEGKVYDGEQEAIVSEETWNRVQQTLLRNRLNGGAVARAKRGSLLGGILRCAACGEAMIHSPTRKGGRQYRYYVCRSNREGGRNACTTGSVPAADLEKRVVERIRAIGKDPGMVAMTYKAACADRQKEIPALRKKKEEILAHLKRMRREMDGLFEMAAVGGRVAQEAAARIERLQDRIQGAENLLREMLDTIGAVDAAVINKQDLRAALGLFDPVWDALLPRERYRLIGLLLERAEFDRQRGKLVLTLRPAGIRTLAAEMRGTE